MQFLTHPLSCASLASRSSLHLWPTPPRTGGLPPFPMLVLARVDSAELHIRTAAAQGSKVGRAMRWEAILLAWVLQWWEGGRKTELQVPSSDPCICECHVEVERDCSQPFDWTPWATGAAGLVVGWAFPRNSCRRPPESAIESSPRRRGHGIVVEPGAGSERGCVVF